MEYVLIARSHQLCMPTPEVLNCNIRSSWFFESCCEISDIIDTHMVMGPFEGVFWRWWPDRPPQRRSFMDRTCTQLYSNSLEIWFFASIPHYIIHNLDQCSIARPFQSEDRCSTWTIAYTRSMGLLRTPRVWNLLFRALATGMLSSFLNQ